MPSGPVICVSPYRRHYGRDVSRRIVDTVEEDVSRRIVDTVEEEMCLVISWTPQGNALLGVVCSIIEQMPSIRRPVAVGKRETWESSMVNKCERMPCV